MNMNLWRDFERAIEFACHVITVLLGFSVVLAVPAFIILAIYMLLGGRL